MMAAVTNLAGTALHHARDAMSGRVLGCRAVGRGLGLLLGLIAAGDAAWGQTAQCHQLRGELASLGRRSSRANAAAQGMEAARLMGHYRQIGCERTGFFIFGGPPAECGPIAARINALRSNAEGSYDGASEGRRRQLAAAVSRACSTPSDTAERSARHDPARPAREKERVAEGPGAGSRSSGARHLVCVRTCDGFFFPLSNSPRGGSPDEMCRALCPGAETAAYHMPGEDIGRAVSTKGKAYTQLASAFRFQKSLDASCSCKKPNESWAVVLQRAEAMLGRIASDVIVTARRSEELSRPKAVRSAIASARPSGGTGEESGRQRRVTVTFGADAPAAESIDQAADQSPSMETAQVAEPAEAEAARSVRVVSPDILPAPQTRTQ